MQLKRNNSKTIATLALNLKALEGLEGKVGWFPSAKYDDGTSVAYVAAIQELGAPSQSIPPRPFMRPTAAEKQSEWRQWAAEAARKALSGKWTALQAMDSLALKAASDVAVTITKITEPALSPITLELRAMKRRDPSLQITGATVGIAAARVNEPGYKLLSGTSTKPLIDSGLLLRTLSASAEGKGGSIPPHPVTGG